MMKKFFYLTAILTIVLVSCNSEKKYKEKLSNAASNICIYNRLLLNIL